MQDPARIFEGNIVLVTGAASGIGKCIATEFAKKGADIALNDIARAQLAKTCQEIKRVGVTAKQFVFDVSDGKEVRRSIDEVEKMMGKIDILVNNAGIATGTDFLEMNDEE